MFTAATIVSVILMFLVLVIFITLAWGAMSAAPWVPLWKKDIKRMLELAEVKPGELVYDLGAGDGRIIIMAAKKFQAKSIGYEMAVLPYFIGYITILLSGLRGKVKLQYKNFYQQDLSDADVVCTFLSPQAMEKLKVKFKKELKPGCRIATFAFKIHGWQEIKIDRPNKKITPVYIYQM